MFSLFIQRRYIKWNRTVIVGISKLGKVKEFEIELIENPSQLGELEKEILIGELNAITKDAFDKDVPMEETRERTVEVDMIYLVRNGEDVVGYMTNDIMTLAGHKVTYFSSAFLKREVQGNGLYNLINEFRLGTANGVIMTRTQNPLVMKGFHDLCKQHGFQFFPNGIMREEVLMMAREYSPNVEDDLICRGVYGRELMSETPLPNHETRELFDKLDVKKGDGVILIGIK